MNRKTWEILIFGLLGFCFISLIIYQGVTVSYKYGCGTGYDLGKYAGRLGKVSAYGQGYEDGFLVGQKYPYGILTRKRPSGVDISGIKISLDDEGEILIKDLENDDY
jgi:hypothetical protein